MTQDQYYMKKALFLAQLKKGTTSPKPTVAAILVDQKGKAIAQGVTQPTGEHAEQMVLNSLDTRITKGCTLYVTLEPCCIKVNTPSCTHLIIEKEIKRVVVATIDQNPKIKGKGLEILKDHGIEVDFGLYEKQAKEINEDFFIAIQKKRPMVFAKIALSLDGFMAIDHSGSQVLSNKRSLKISHLLRYRSDAILVGSQTVLSDNPTLNIRNPLYKKTLLRVILDPTGEVPLESNVLSDSLPTLIVLDPSQVSLSKIKQIQKVKDKEVFLKPQEAPLDDLLTFLYEKKGVLSLMVEGGGYTLASFLEQKLLDKMFIFSTPWILGNGIGPFSNLSINKMGDAPILENVKFKLIDNNVLMYGNVKCH